VTFGVPRCSGNAYGTLGRFESSIKIKVKIVIHPCRPGSYATRVWNSGAPFPPMPRWQSAAFQSELIPTGNEHLPVVCLSVLPDEVSCQFTEENQLGGPTEDLKAISLPELPQMTIVGHPIERIEPVVANRSAPT